MSSASTPSSGTPSTASSVPPPHAGARAIGKRPRVSRFMRFLLTITTLTHVPFVIACSEGLHRVGVASPACWAIAVALGAFGIFMFVGRAKNMMNDAHRPWAQTFLVDIPYFAHWSACIYCAIPSILYVIVAALFARV